jgi:mRNA interferase MazF
MFNPNIQIRRGEVYYTDFSGGIGCEQAGEARPAVIISNEFANRHSPVILVAPLTSRKARRLLPTQVPLSKHENHLKYDSLVLTEQSRVVDKQRLKDYITYLDESKLREIDACIAISFGLAEPNWRGEQQNDLQQTYE